MNDSTRRQDQLTDEVIRRARGCLPAEDLITYHEGTMGANNRHTLEAHLPGCVSCRAALEYLASDAAQQPGGQTTLPQAVEERIEALMAAAVRQEPESSSRSVPGRAWMKLAAGVFLAASLALFGSEDRDIVAVRLNGGKRLALVGFARDTAFNGGVDFVGSGVVPVALAFPGSLLG